MSYQTGTPTSSTNLLQTLVTWLVSLGWTQDRSAVEGSGWTATLHKSGNYVHFRAAENESAIWNAIPATAHYGIHMGMGTGFVSGQPFKNQITGAPFGSSSSFPIGVGMKLAAGPFSNYFFFADATADNIIVVCEKTPGLYVFLGWGSSLQKAGSYTGGPYFFGPSAGYYVGQNAGANVPGYTSTSDCPFVRGDQNGGGTGFVRADVDTFTGKWLGIIPLATPDQGYTGKFGDTSVRGTGQTMSTNFPVFAKGAATTTFQYEQTSQQDGRANLLPIILWANRDSTTTGFSMLGTVPNIFFSNGVGNGFSNADEYVIGSTTYKMFPNFAVVKQ